MSLNLENGQPIDEIFFDLVKIVDSSVTGYYIDKEQAIGLAQKILSSWSLGPIGRLKSGAYWILKKISCSKNVKNWLEYQRAISVAHSAIIKYRKHQHNSLLLFRAVKIKTE